MSAILYWDKNFKGETSTVTPNDPPCNGPDDYVSKGLGKCGYMSCSDQIKDHCDSFGGQVNSFKIDDGIIYRAYSEHKYNGNTIDLMGTSDHMPDGWSNRIFSYKVLKDCNNSKWMWDPDCNVPNSNDNFINPCVDSTNNKCFQNKVLLAQSADLNKDINMLNWCQTHTKECEAPLKRHCKTIDNVNTDYCKKWCNDNSGECDNTFTDFCKIHKDDLSCSCFNTPEPLETFAKNNKIDPLCLNNNCKKYGYKTKDIKLNCDPCLDKVNFKETNIDKLLNDIQVSCNLIPKSNFQIFWENNTTFIIIALITIVIVSIITVIYFTS